MRLESRKRPPAAFARRVFHPLWAVFSSVSMVLSCGGDSPPSPTAQAATALTGAPSVTGALSGTAAAPEGPSHKRDPCMGKLPQLPACEERGAFPGPWPRAGSNVQVIAGEPGRSLGALEQSANKPEPARLRFLGTHLYDLLDKVVAEGGPNEASRRKMICEVLNAVADRGAPVVRIWGTLKRTGVRGEVERAHAALGLVLDENARRQRPLRFLVTLLNHQAGYGLPAPESSLDDQKAPGWNARDVYLGGAWKRPGIGQLAERIDRYRADPQLFASPYVLGWELVNELDTHRSIGGGALRGEVAERLSAEFLIPAAVKLAESFPYHPILLGDLRGDLNAYSEFAARVILALPPNVRSRLVWTSHVYVETTSPPPSDSERQALEEQGTRKLDQDLDIARKFGLPLLLGEIGQHVRGAKTAYCQGGATHDIPALFKAVLAPEPDPHGRRDIDAALFWGEGLCGVTVDAARGATIHIGAGGDSADLGPGDSAARAAVVDARAWSRFVLR